MICTNKTARALAAATTPATRSAGSDHPERNVALVLRALVLLSAIVAGLSGTLSMPRAFWAVACAYGAVAILEIVFPRVLRSGRRGRAALFLIDVCALSALVMLRGTETQALLVAVFALMLMAATVEGMGHALLNVLLVSAAYVVLTRWGATASELLSVVSLSHIALFVVSGALMGHAAEQARALSSKQIQSERRHYRARKSLRRTWHDLRESEEQLESARESLQANDRLYTLGMLSAGVSHELKNPIAVILACIAAADEMIKERALECERGTDLLGPDLADALDECRLACDHLGRLVGDLNNLARAGRRKAMGTVRLSERVQIAGRLLRKLAGQDVEVSLDIEPELRISGDSGRVLQVVLNLGKNAIDALQEDGGGTLNISCRALPDEGVEVLVEDDGPGIPEKVQSRMFDPFVTTKGPGRGTGLGLHLVREIVTSHEGTIECESTEGEGSRFRLRFPPVQEKRSEDHAERESEDPVGGRSGVGAQGALPDASPRSVRTGPHAGRRDGAARAGVGSDHRVHRLRPQHAGDPGRGVPVASP